VRGILNHRALQIPKATIKRVVVTVAVLAAGLSLVIPAIFHFYLGTVLLYTAGPFLAAMLVWAIVGITRLRLVGLLPSMADHFIPLTLKPWIQFWMLFKLGLFGSMLLLLATAILSAVIGGPTEYFIEGLVYLVWFKLFIDLLFGTAFNAGIISRRKNTR
jgi:hypothetical protein